MDRFRTIGRGLFLALAFAFASPSLAGAALTQTAEKVLSPRLHELTFSTPALNAPARVRILLPVGYDAEAGRRYPVVYLLHGAGGTASDWTEQGDAEAATAKLGVIVVMPDGGQFGGYVDWFAAGRAAPQQWETFHLDELVPWVDAHLRTRPGRSGRAVVGLSMGGGGAMTYAALHPDRFLAAASFSGELDTGFPANVALIEAEGVAVGGPGAGRYGPRVTQEIRWRGHNALDLAANLRGVDVTLRTGNGAPGGPDGSRTPDPLEQAVHEETVSMHRALEALGQPHVYDDYGPGSHSWFYWARDLRATLPRLMADFASPSPPPSRVTYTAIAPRFGAYGWDVELDRPALAFATLRDAGSTGFRLVGSGRGSVRTPARYRPGAAIQVSVRDVAGASVHRLRADGTGRLSVPVSLGPGDTQQALTPGASTAQRAAAVTLSPVCGRRARRRVRLRTLAPPRHVRTVTVRVQGHRPLRLRGPRRVVTVTGRPGAAVTVTVRTRAGRSVIRHLELPRCPPA